MFVNLLIGTLMMVLNLGIQVLAISFLIRHFNMRIGTHTATPGSGKDIRSLSTTMAVLFAGHIFQFATWAALFFALGEFTTFEEAFYHSTVNFTSLGYGDIVMSEGHRLLGALEAANGVLMFGLSAGGILSVMNFLFGRHQRVAHLKKKITSQK